MTSILLSRFRSVFAAAIFALVIITGTAACAGTGGGRLYVRVGPPAPIYEPVYASPGAGYTWVPGYYRWDGRGYNWERGRWVRPPRARAHWSPGHWARTNRGWYFVDGRWR